MSVVNKQSQRKYKLVGDVLEAGLQLLGHEVKSIHSKGTVNISQAYVVIRGGEMWLINAHIQPYVHIGYAVPDATRARKLLVHKKEVLEMRHKAEAGKLSIIPVRLYKKKNRYKLAISLAQGRSHEDMRQRLRDKAVQRDNDRTFRNR
jgi:SsrA-binding protein